MLNVTKVSKTKRYVLENIIELYLYDLNDIYDDYTLFELNADGRFLYPDLDSYWRDKSKIPYIFWQQDKPVGCALIHHQPFFPQTDSVHVIGEFFILRKYRRQGLGIEACRQLMALHPGFWEIRVVYEHTKGMAFWRQMLTRLTPDNHRIHEKNDNEWSGYVLCADSTLSKIPK